MVRSPAPRDDVEVVLVVVLRSYPRRRDVPPIPAIPRTRGSGEARGDRPTIIDDDDDGWRMRSDDDVSTIATRKNVTAVDHIFGVGYSTLVLVWSPPPSRDDERAFLQPPSPPPYSNKQEQNTPPLLYIFPPVRLFRDGGVVLMGNEIAVSAVAVTIF
jgi:hypothetical protein